MEDGRFEHFMTLMSVTAKSIQRLKTSRMEPFGLSAAHTDCLYHLLAVGAPGLTQRELCDRLQMDRAQVCRVLRELRDREFVAPQAHGGYKSRYALTDSGLKTAQQVRAIIREIHTFVSGEIPAEDIAVFYKTLTTISANLIRAVKLYSTPDENPTEKE